MNAYIIVNKNTGDLLAMSTDLPTIRGAAYDAVLIAAPVKEGDDGIDVPLLNDEDTSAISCYTGGRLETTVGIIIKEVPRSEAIELANRKWF